MTRPDADPNVVKGLHQLENALDQAKQKGNQELAELIAEDLGSLAVSLHPDIMTDAIENRYKE